MPNIFGQDLKDFFEHANKLSEQVKVVGNEIIINVNHPYHIPLEECSTHQGILHWVWHISKKTWMTTEVLQKFIEVACDYHKLPYTTA
ncbi:hypothetical protein ACNY68_02760 [Pantoea sp. KXB25]|uniref:hypothetical protein n=1 Tax=unclassified Pantoea TaxID=2630326 RepID=UPI003AB7648A